MNARTVLAIGMLGLALPSTSLACSSISRELSNKIADAIATQVQRMESNLDSPRASPSILVRSAYGSSTSYTPSEDCSKAESKVRDSVRRNYPSLTTLSDTTSALLNQQAERALMLGAAQISPSSANSDPQYFDTNYVALIYGADDVKELRCATELTEIARIDVVSLITTEIRSVDPISNQYSSAWDVFNTSRIGIRHTPSVGIYLEPPRGQIICPRLSTITVSSASQTRLATWQADLGCVNKATLLTVPDTAESFGGSYLTQRGYVSIQPVDRGRRCGVASSDLVDIRTPLFPRSQREGYMPNSPVSQCVCGPAPIGSTIQHQQCAYGVAEVQTCSSPCFPNNTGSHAVCVF